MFLPEALSRVIFSQPLVLRRAPRAGKSGVFVGVASSWTVDRHGTYLARGAFARSIAAFEADQLRIPLLYEHDPLQQLGAIVRLAETDAGLEVEAQIVLGVPLADRIYALAQADGVGLSVGFNPRDDGIRIDGDGGLAYTDVDLMEISTTSVASNRESFVHTVRNYRELAPADLERLLRDQLQMPRRLAAKVARAACDDTEPEDDPAELRRRLADWERRAGELRATVVRAYGTDTPLARAFLPIIGSEHHEPEHEPADVAALAAALDGLSRTFKR